MKKKPKQSKFDFMNDIPKSSKSQNKKKLINKIKERESEEQLELKLDYPDYYELWAPFCLILKRITLSKKQLSCTV